MQRTGRKSRFFCQLFINPPSSLYQERNKGDKTYEILQGKRYLLFG